MQHICNDDRSHSHEPLARVMLSNHSAAKQAVALVRILSFAILYTLDWWHRLKVRKSADQSTSAARSFAVLPSYYDYLNGFVLCTLVYGVLDVACPVTAGHNITITSCFAVYHFYFESLSAFLLQPGAGRRDMITAVTFGGASALIAAVV